MIITNSVSDGGVPVNFVFPCPFFQFSAKNHLDFFVYLKKFTLNINRNGYCLMEIWIFTFVFRMFDLASIDEDDVIEKIQKSNLFEWETKSPVGSIYPFAMQKMKIKKKFPILSQETNSNSKEKIKRRKDNSLISCVKSSFIM